MTTKKFQILRFRIKTKYFDKSYGSNRNNDKLYGLMKDMSLSTTLYRYLKYVLIILTEKIDFFHE